MLILFFLHIVLTASECFSKKNPVLIEFEGVAD
jgi:hypothetical protein